MTSTLDITKVYGKRMRKPKNIETSTLELIHEVEILITTENMYEKNATLFKIQNPPKSTNSTEVIMD